MAAFLAASSPDDDPLAVVDSSLVAMLIQVGVVMGRVSSCSPAPPK